MEVLSSSSFIAVLPFGLPRGIWGIVDGDRNLINRAEREWFRCNNNVMDSKQAESCGNGPPVVWVFFLENFKRLAEGVGWG